MEKDKRSLESESEVTSDEEEDKEIDEEEKDASGEDGGKDEGDKSSKGEKKEDVGEGGEDATSKKDPLATFKYYPELYWKKEREITEELLFGEVKDYCIVTLHDKGILRRGDPTYNITYNEKLYHFVDEEAKEHFLKNPNIYLKKGHIIHAVSPKICITGSPGSGQVSVGRTLAKKHCIYCIDFRARLQEILRAKLGKDIGPNYPPLNLNNRFGESGEYEGEVPFPREFSEHIKSTLSEIGEANMNPFSAERHEEAFVGSSAIASIARLEKIAGRDWSHMMPAEMSIKAFLERGTQLPFSVLDEFVAPFFKDPPFNETGFIIVGFPNTPKDLQYLIDHEFIPEYVFVVESNPKVTRNRLLVQTVDTWHKKNNPSGLKVAVDKLPEWSPNIEKIKNEQYAKSCPEFYFEEIDNRETWTYNDKSSKIIGEMLIDYHRIYSQHLTSLKNSLNKERINWMPIHSDLSLKDATEILSCEIHTLLRDRCSYFEQSWKNLVQTNDLLNRGKSRLGKCYPIRTFDEKMAMDLEGDEMDGEEIEDDEIPEMEGAEINDIEETEITGIS